MSLTMDAQILLSSELAMEGAVDVLPQAGRSKGKAVVTADRKSRPIAPPNWAVLTDEEVMLFLQQGRDEALDEIYRRHYKGVFAFLVRMVQDRHLAEDLLQETFIRIFNSRATWEPRSKLTSWLYRIARNLCIDEKRRYWNRLVLMDSQTQSQYDDNNQSTILERTETNHPDPRAAACERVDAERIHKAINALSEEQREVMILNKYHGLSYAEIAEVLEVSPESVKQRAYRAHLKLRELLSPLLEEYG